LMQVPLILSKRVARVDARDDEHRYGIGSGLSHRGYRIGKSRTGNQQADTWLARNPRIAICHEARILFVARGNMPDARSGKATIKFGCVHARNAKYCIDIVSFQKADQRLPDRYFAAHE